MAGRRYTWLPLLLAGVSLCAAIAPVLGSNATTTAAPDVCDDEPEELFPGNIFTDDQRRHGVILIHFVVAFYGFTTIALVCEDYFLPAVEVICDVMNLPPDIAGATFMSMATSSPELFVNIVSTFIADSKMGVGTTVGSATFNVLGIATFSGLAAVKPIQLRYQHVWRDSLIYMMAVAVVALVAFDGRVDWYESLAMVLCSIAYLVFMFSQRRLARWAKTLLRSGSTVKLTRASSESPSVEAVSTIDTEAAVVQQQDLKTEKVKEEPPQQEKEKEKKKKGILRRAWWVVSRPVALALFCTVPDCQKRPRLFVITFLMSVVWIAIAAYIVSWMLSIVGHTFRISDAVMGITFLAAGGSMPEGVSSVIMARKGVGSMGISNGLGANTLNILMNLGMPWLIRSLAWPNKTSHVLSDGLIYNLVAIFGAVIALNIILLISKYRLSKCQGAVTLCVYMCFLTFMVLTELNVFHFFNRVCS